MAYNFKNLADVELLGAMPENANVFVEVDGATKRAPKEDGIGKLVSVEALEEVPENATVLAEVNGEIKRVPSAGLGGEKKIIFSVIEAAEAIDTPTYQTVCNYSNAEVAELIMAGATCVMVLPYAVMAAATPSMLDAVSAEPTNVEITALLGASFSDGMHQFMFFSMGSEAFITYYADGTIENSLIPTVEQPEE